VRAAAVLLSLALVGGVVSAACGLTAVGKGQEIAVRAGERGTEMYFEPQRIVVPAGATVTFVITNEGTQDHEFESAEEGEAGIDEILIPPGRTRRVVWTAPRTPAVYPVYCDLPGHREAGMELTLEVVAAAPTP
jgi:uncharacterized cupredoxin-like copper-binding protein